MASLLDEKKHTNKLILSVIETYHTRPREISVRIILSMFEIFTCRNKCWYILTTVKNICFHNSNLSRICVISTNLFQMCTFTLKCIFLLWNIFFYINLYNRYRKVYFPNRCKSHGILMLFYVNEEITFITFFSPEIPL